MQRTLISAVSIGLLLVAGVVPAQSAEDHLKCYKVKDPLRLKGDPASAYWLDLTGPQFGGEDCKIVGGFRLVCVPVEKTLTPPVLGKLVPGASWEELTPTPIPGPTEGDKLCYKIKCSDRNPAPPNPSQDFTDQFASRTLTKFKPYVVCGPAVKGPTFERFVDNGDGTLTDRTTGLMWEQKQNLDSTPDYNDPHDADNQYSWSSTGGGVSFPPDGTAFTDFLWKLNGCMDDGTDPPTGVTGGFAGHCDWRLPTIVELQTILDPTLGYCGGLSGVCIDETVFGPTAPGSYSSSTGNPGFLGFVWVLDFDVGTLAYGNRLSDFLVRAVRGGL